MWEPWNIVGIIKLYYAGGDVSCLTNNIVSSSGWKILQISEILRIEGEIRINNYNNKAYLEQSRGLVWGSELGRYDYQISALTSLPPLPLLQHSNLFSSLLCAGQSHCSSVISQDGTLQTQKQCARGAEVSQESAGWQFDTLAWDLIKAGLDTDRQCSALPWRLQRLRRVSI